MRKITETKEGTKLGDLCKGLPAELHEYFRRVRNLKFEEQPNYLGLKTLFRDLFVRRGFVFDYQYDWSTRLHPPRTQTAQKPAMVLPPPPQPNTQPPSGHHSPRESDELKPLAMANRHSAPKIFAIKPPKTRARNRGRLEMSKRGMSNPQFRVMTSKAPGRQGSSPNGRQGMGTRLTRVVLPKIPEE